jgi:hypothetical protein
MVIKLGLTLMLKRRLRLFKNRLLRKIPRTRGAGVNSRAEKKLHNEELHDLYSSPNIIRVMKSRRMRWAGHVARMGDRRRGCRVLVGNLRERDQLENLGVNGSKILK